VSDHTTMHDAQRHRRLVESIFQRAADAPPERRSALIAELCGTDSNLGEEVRSLLRRFDEGTISVLRADNAPAALLDGIVEKPGDRLGNYTIVDTLGEGGFGMVYVADQSEPVRRRVALKILKAGMDTASVLQRFGAERQALALMDHPSIAKVLDAGSTPTGRPYFVMELVHGPPLTRYCDERTLTTRQRLELFVQVCRAVQHAHQKGVIHRDLKPSNILVSNDDGRPLPKVIDFGIAKATSAALTDNPAFTLQDQVMGTPEYMSPEQAGSAGRDIDTRTDIYSLGVILYELLAGALPFDSGTLRSGGLVAMQQVIREVDPPRPSTRLSSLTHELQHAAAANRRTDAATLRRSLRGDLEWIILKAMEKDRARRYDSAAAFAADVERHLRDEPVLASPPGATYRVGKFVRRHRTGVAAGAAVAIALIAGLAAAATGFVRASRERDLAVVAQEAALRSARIARQEATKAAEVSRFLNGVLTSVDPDRAQGKEPTVRSVIDEAAKRLDADGLEDQPDVRAELLETIGGVYQALGFYKEARDNLAQAVELIDRVDPVSLRAAQVREELATAHIDLNEFKPAEELLVRAEEIRRATPGPDDDEGPQWPQGLAAIYYHTGRYAEGEALLRRFVARAEANKDHDRSALIDALTGLGTNLEAQGRYEEAIPLLERAVAERKALHPDGHTSVANALNGLANTLEAASKLDRAELAHRESLAIKRRLLSPDHPDTGTTLNNLGLVLSRQGKLVEAEQMLREALRIRRASLPTPHSNTAATVNNLARCIAEQGPERRAEAITLMTQALEEAKATVPEGHIMLSAFRGNLGNLLWQDGRNEEGGELLSRAYEDMTKAVGPAHRRSRLIAGYLADMYAAKSLTDESRKWRDLASEPPNAK
jgi:serine/threonine protein kinase/tetratricopeptide (TPR) repeat protein